MKKSFSQRILAMTMAVCMALSMIVPGSAAYKYTLQLLITEEGTSFKPNTLVENKITVEDNSSVSESGDLTTELVYLLAANFEGDAEKNKDGLWQFESDAMGLTIEAGLRANRKSDEAWFAWIDTFASEGRITGDSEDKGDLVALLKNKAKISDMELNTEYVLYYEPDNTVKLNPDLNMTLSDEDPAKGNTYIFTLTLVRSVIGEDYPITVNRVTNGTAKADKERAEAGEKVTVTAKADPGYVIDTVKVLRDDNTSVRVTSNGDGTYSFTMPAGAVSVTVATKAEVKDYPITVNRVTNGTAVADKERAEAGEKVTITTTAKEGYVVDTVKVTQNGTPVAVTDNGDGIYSFIMPAGAVSVTVTTKAEAKDYPITVNRVTNGTAVADKERAEAGEKVTITTTAKEGYVVDTVKVIQNGTPVAVTDNGDGTYSFTMPAGAVSITVTTKTEAKDYPITVNSVTNGTAKANKKRAKEGKEVTVTAKADPGYVIDTVKVTRDANTFVRVTDNGDGTYSFTMPASAVSVTVTTKAEGEKYPITVHSVTNGTAKANKERAEAGEKVTITAKGDPGYVIDTVKVTRDDNTSVKVTDNGKGTYSFTMPAGAVSVTVTTKSEGKEHPITVNGVAHGAASTNVERAKKGEKVTITTTTDPGYVVNTVRVMQGDKLIQVKRNKDGNYYFNMPDGPVTVTVTTTRENYAIKVENVTNGSAMTDFDNAQVGDKVTIEADAFKGYELDDIKVTCGTVDVTVTDNGDGTYSFIMPDGNVVVNATTRPRNYRVDTVIDRGTAVSNVQNAKMGDMVSVTTNIPSGYVVASITVTVVAPVMYRLRAVPRAAGLEFTDNGDGTYSFVMPADDVLVSITTVAKKHSVTVNDVNNGSAETDKTYEEKDETVTITPSVDDGYVVDEVKVTTGTGDTAEEIIVTPNENGDYTFEMPEGDVEVTVTTKPKEYSITVNDVNNGSAGTDLNSAKADDTVTITTSADDGYVVDKVEVTCGTAPVQVTPSGDGTYSFKMPVGDVVVTVTTRAKPSGGTGNTVTVEDVTNGNATADVERAEEGETVTITTSADAGHEVDNIEVNCGDEKIDVIPNGDGTYSFKMPDGDVVVTVTTKANEYNVTVNDVANGSATPNVNTAKAGETVTITTSADTGYEVNSVKVNCGGAPVWVTPGNDGKYSFEMPIGDVTVDVITKAKDYTVTVNTVINGNATADASLAKMGETVTVTANASLGYAVDTVKVTGANGNVALTNNGDGTYSFTMPASAVTVDVTTKIEKYLITVTDVDNGDAEASVERASMGDMVTITASAEAGYAVNSIEVTCGTTPIAFTDNGNGTYSFKMPAGAVAVNVTTIPQDYRINVETVVNGSVTTDEDRAKAGKKVTITPTVDEGYEVNTVTVTCGDMPVLVTPNNDGTYFFEMPVGDVTVSATTRSKPREGNGFDVTVKVESEEEGVANGNAAADVVQAEKGETVVVTANANTGHVVDKITVTTATGDAVEEIIVTPNEDGDYTFEMPDDHVEVTVTTKALQYDVTVRPVENGDALTKIGENEVNQAKAGQTVTIHATTEEGHEVKSIKVTSPSDDGTPILITKDIDKNGERVYKFTMPASGVTVNVETESTSGKYSVFVTSVTNGTAKADKERAEAGDKVKVIAKANEGYVVDTVKVIQNGTPVAITNNGDGTYSFIMPAGNVAVIVTTKAKSAGDGPVSQSYPITVNSVANGTATADATRALLGKKVTVTATADEGYVVDKVKVTWGSGSVLVTDNGDGTYSFTMPAGAVAVTVITKAKVAPPTDPSAPGHGTNCPASRFDDVDLNEWYHKAIDYVVYNGLMAGLDEKNFGPDWELSRAMCAQIFFNLEGQPGGVYDNPFPDVAQGKWYYDAVTWAFAHGVVSGYGDGLYRPEQIVTREELVQIYCNYAKAKGWSEGTRIADLTIFVDYEDVAPWHEVAVSWGVGSKLLGGKGGNVMAPKVPGTRAEAAQMLMNMCENIKK